MNSIYKQMNNIDDNESLSEKYNVRTLKDVKKLHESRDIKVITGEELRVAISEELPYLEEERGPNATLEDAIDFIIDHLLEARIIFDKDEVVKIVTELQDGRDESLTRRSRAKNMINL